MNIQLRRRLPCASVIMMMALTVLVLAEQPLVLTATPMGDGTVDLAFFSTAEKLYTLEYRDDLNGFSAWQEMEDFRLQEGNGESMSFRDLTATAVTKRYYRIRMQQPASPEDDWVTLVYYSFSATNAVADTTYSNVSASAFLVNQSPVTSFGTQNSPSWTNSGVPYASAQSGWTATAPADAKYFASTLTAAGEYTFSLSNINFEVRSTANGPSAISVIVNGEEIYTQDMPADSTQFVSVPVFEHENLTQATIRVAGWLNGSRVSTTGGGQLHIDDFTALGSVALPPEPEPDPPVEPLLAGFSAASVTEDSAIISATILETGGAVIAERGIYWSTDPEFNPLEGNKVSEFGEFEPGEFSIRVSGLPADTIIYFYAFASNAEGVGFSDLSFIFTPGIDELAYYSFSDQTTEAEAHRNYMEAYPVTLSAGEPTFSWLTSQASSWQALGAREPYLEIAAPRAELYWTATNAFEARYFEIPLAADPGFLLSVTGISFVARSTPAGPPAVGAIVNGELMPTVVDLPASKTTLVQFPISEAYHDLSNIVIRIPAWRNGSRDNGTGSGALRIDEIRIQGFLTMVQDTDEPTVNQPTVASISAHEATLGGMVVNDGGSTVLERGIYWSLDPTFTAPNGGIKFAETGAFPTGSFSVATSQLPLGTTIYFRAFASTAAGTGYSASVGTFNTPAPEPTMLARYEFTGQTYTPHLLHPSLSASHLISGSGKQAISVATEFGSGSPVSQMNGGFKAASPEEATRYLIFHKEARPGTAYQLTNIQFRARATAEGPSAITVFIDDTASFTTNIPSSTLIQVNLPVTDGINRTQSRIRIAMWDNGSRNTKGTGIVRIDDVTIRGTVTGTPASPIEEGRRVRVATMNIENSIGSPGEAQYEAVKQVIQRLNADIIGFQEIYLSESNTWSQLGIELGYPYSTMASREVQRTAYFSRYPFLEVAQVDTPEIARPILRVTVAVPDTDQPLVLWNAHKKAFNNPTDQFRRTIETHRLIQNIQAYTNDNPQHVALLVMGDFNADVFTQPQSVVFTNIPDPDALPQSYQLGADIVFPIAYAYFPDRQYRESDLNFSRPIVTHADQKAMYSFENSTFLSRLDYLYISPALAAQNPVGEIYFSSVDGAYPGLVKSGSPLAANVSYVSSDHLPVFVDLWMSTNGSWQTTSSTSTASQQAMTVESESATEATTSSSVGSSTGIAMQRERPSPSIDVLQQVALETQIEIIMRETGGVEIRFPTQNGIHYTLQYRDGLNAAEDWTHLGAYADMEGTGEFMHCFDPANPPPVSGIRFYRVRMD